MTDKSVHILTVVVRLRPGANIAAPNVKRWRKLPISIVAADIRPARGKRASAVSD